MHTVCRVIKDEPCFKSSEKSGFEIHNTKNEITCLMMIDVTHGTKIG
jgi:hypothetical protein